MKKSKMIGGKRFTRESTWKYKFDAKQRAHIRRLDGYKARVIKEKRGQTNYSVYTRWRR